MKTRIILPFLLFAMACTSEKTGQSDTSEEPVISEVAETTSCYASVMGRDTMLLRLERLNDRVTGDLSYNFYEKDDNSGSIQGQMHGDTLLADYTFMSEGTESLRQVVFLQKEGSFVEGYGDMEEQGGRMVFKNTAPLDFASGTVFRKVPCPEK